MLYIYKYLQIDFIILNFIICWKIDYKIF